jgi:hypothetical protein
MNEYHKIQSMFKRDMPNGGKMLIGEWTTPEFEYLKDNRWVFTEKVDGTNIRVMWNGKAVSFGGKTDNAQLHMDLIIALQNMFDGTPRRKLFADTFSSKEGEETQVCFYGEGYGAGIQKGGTYRPDKSFVLFDIKIGNWWLQRKDVEEIASTFGIDIVPIVGEGTLEEGMELVRAGMKSTWGDFTSEGIVARPKVEMKTRRGDRMITKIKHRDFS